MKDKNKITSEQISRVNFNIELKGYKIEEIDEYLDEIQQDYIYFEETIKNLKVENKVLNVELKNKSDELSTTTTLLNQLRSENEKSIRSELADSSIIQKISRIEDVLKQMSEQLQELRKDTKE